MNNEQKNGFIDTLDNNQPINPNMNGIPNMNSMPRQDVSIGSMPRQDVSIGSMPSQDVNVGGMPRQDVNMEMTSGYNSMMNMDGMNNSSVSTNEPNKVDLMATQVVPPVQPTVQPSSSSNGMDTSWKDPKKDKKKFIIPAVIVLVVAICIFGVYYFYYSPSAVYKRIVTKGFDTIEDSFNETKHNTVKGKGSIDYEITSSLPTTQELFDLFNGIELKYEYGVDYKQKIANFKINSTYNNDKLLNLDSYLQNGNFYLGLQDLYDKYISGEMDEYDAYFNMNNVSEDFTTVMNGLEKAFLNSYKSKDIVKSKTSLTVNGKVEKVNKVSLVMDSKNANRIFKALLTNLKNDKDFIKAYASLCGGEQSEIEQMLQDGLNEMENKTLTDGSSMEVGFYTKGALNDFLGLDITIKDQTQNVSITLVNEGNGKVSFKLNTAGADVVKGSITTNTTGNTEKSVVELNVQDVFTVKVNLSESVEYDKEIEEGNVTNSVDYNLLTEQDLNTIMNNAMNSKGLMALIENIQMLSGSMTLPSDPSGSMYGYEDYPLFRKYIEPLLPTTGESTTPNGEANATQGTDNTTSNQVTE